MNYIPIICRIRNVKQNFSVNPTRISYRASTILKVVEKSQSKILNKKTNDIDDDGEVISPEVCIGPAKNKTHSVRVLYNIEKSIFSV